jgi:hypothetical protein
MQAPFNKKLTLQFCATSQRHDLSIIIVPLWILKGASIEILRGRGEERGLSVGT